MLAHPTLRHRQSDLRTTRPILALTYNYQRHHLVTCDAVSIRLFSLRRELAVLWLDDDERPLDVVYLPDVYLVIYDHKAQLLHSSLASLFAWSPHESRSATLKCCTALSRHSSFATATADELRVWQLQENTPVLVTELHASFTRLHSNCDILAAASPSRSVSIFDCHESSLKKLHDFQLASDVTCLRVISQTLVAAGTADGTITVWNTTTRAPQCDVIKAHCLIDKTSCETRLSGVFSLCGAADSDYTIDLFSCGEETETGKRSFKHYQIPLCPSSRTAIELTEEHPFSFDKAEDSAQVSAPPVQAELCFCDEQKFFVATNRERLTIYDALAPEWRVATASDRIIQLAASATNIVALTENSSLEAFDNVSKSFQVIAEPTTDPKLTMETRPSAEIRARRSQRDRAALAATSNKYSPADRVALSSQQNTTFVARSDGVLEQFDARKCHVNEGFSVKNAMTACCRCNNSIVVGDADGCLHQLSGTSVTKSLQAHSGAILLLVANVEGNFIASAAADGIVKIWHAPNANLVLVAHMIAHDCTAMSLTANMVIVLAFRSGNLISWPVDSNTSSGQPREIQDICDNCVDGAHSLEITSLDTKRDFVLSASIDRRLCCWQLRDGSLILLRSFTLAHPIYTAMMVDREDACVYAMVADDKDVNSVYFFSGFEKEDEVIVSEPDVFSSSMASSQVGTIKIDGTFANFDSSSKSGFSSFNTGELAQHSVGSTNRGSIASSTEREPYAFSTPVEDPEDVNDILPPSAQELMETDVRLRVAFDERTFGSKNVAASALGGLLRSWWGKSATIPSTSKARLTFLDVCEMAALLCQEQKCSPDYRKSRGVVAPVVKSIRRKQYCDMSRERKYRRFNIMGEAVVETTAFSDNVAPGDGPVQTYSPTIRQRPRLSSLTSRNRQYLPQGRLQIVPESLSMYFFEPNFSELRNMKMSEGGSRNRLLPIATTRAATNEARKVFEALRRHRGGGDLAKVLYESYRLLYGHRRSCEAKIVALIDGIEDFGSQSAALRALGSFLGLRGYVAIPQHWARLYTGAIDWFSERAMLHDIREGVLAVRRQDAALCASDLAGEAPVVSSIVVDRLSTMTPVESSGNSWEDLVDAEAFAELLVSEWSEAENLAGAAAKQLFTEGRVKLLPSQKDERNEWDGTIGDTLRDLLLQFIARDESRGGAVSESDFVNIMRSKWESGKLRELMVFYKDAWDQNIAYVDLWAMLYTEFFSLKRHHKLPDLDEIYALAINHCVGIDESMAAALQTFITHVKIESTPQKDILLKSVFGPGDHWQNNHGRQPDLRPGTMRILSAPLFPSKSLKQCNIHSQSERQSYFVRARPAVELVEKPACSRSEVTSKIEMPIRERAPRVTSYSRTLNATAEESPKKDFVIEFSEVQSFCAVRFVDDPYADYEKARVRLRAPPPFVPPPPPVVRPSEQALAAESTIGQYSSTGRPSSPIRQLRMSASESLHTHENSITKNEIIASGRSRRRETLRLKEVEAMKARAMRSELHEKKMKELEEEACRRFQGALDKEDKRAAEQAIDAAKLAERERLAAERERHATAEAEAQKRAKAERNEEHVRRLKEQRRAKERDEAEAAEARRLIEEKRRAFNEAQEARILEEKLARARVEEEKRRLENRRIESRRNQDRTSMSENEECGYLIRKLIAKEAVEAEEYRLKEKQRAQVAIETCERALMEKAQESGFVLRRIHAAEVEFRVEQAKYQRVEHIAKSEGTVMQDVTRDEIGKVEKQELKEEERKAELRVRLDVFGRRKEEEERSSSIIMDFHSLATPLTVVTPPAASTTATSTFSGAAATPSRALTTNISSAPQTHPPEPVYGCSFLFTNDFAYVPFNAERRPPMAVRKGCPEDDEDEQGGLELGGLESLPEAAKQAIIAATNADVLTEDSISQLYSETLEDVEVAGIKTTSRDWSRYFQENFPAVQTANDIFSSNRIPFDAKKRAVEILRTKRSWTVDKIRDHETIEALECGVVRAVSSSKTAYYAVDLPGGILTVILECLEGDANLLAGRGRLPTRIDYDWADISLKAEKKIVIRPSDEKYSKGQYIIGVEPARRRASFAVFALCTSQLDNAPEDASSEPPTNLERRLRVFQTLNAQSTLPQLLLDYSLEYARAVKAVDEEMRIEASTAKDIPEDSAMDVKKTSIVPLLAIQRDSADGDFRAGKSPIAAPGGNDRIPVKSVNQKRRRTRKKTRRQNRRGKGSWDVAEIDRRVRILASSCSNPNMLARVSHVLDGDSTQTSPGITLKKPFDPLLSNPVRSIKYHLLLKSSTDLPKQFKRRLQPLVTTTT